jgi:RNA polymerase-binding transcription factor DksA
MDAGTEKQLRTQLEDERGQHLEFLDEHGAPPYGEVVKTLDVGNDGFADSGQATEERAELLSNIDQSRTRVHQIDAALARMDEGNYGLCRVCGEPIQPERLEVRPLSVTCVEHAS